MGRGLAVSILVAAALVAAPCVSGCGKDNSIRDPDVSERLTGDKSGHKAAVSFDLACVDNIDYMVSNSLSNYLEAHLEGQPVDPAMQQLIDSTSFGNAVSLLTGKSSSLEAVYSLKPTPAGVQVADGVTTYTFEEGSLQSIAGVPFVTVEGVLTTGSTSLDRGDGTVLDPEQKKKCLEGTAFWPTDDATVTAAVREAAVPGGASDPEKVEALWSWVRENISYEGPQGTRYGTVQVLSQRYGRCWDKSDVFVTLCRASGVPAREVGGWLSDQDSGHIWAQAYLEGKGWVSVDTTSDHVGAGPDYLPFYATTDGAMPIVYVRMPDVRE